MAVGDVNSTARGSGARYNDGKPDLSLIPLSIIADSFPAGDPVGMSLNLLGLFQTTGDGERLREAIEAVNYAWRDAARVFEYGKKKYAAWNWAKGMAWSIPLACAGRHALAMLEGEQNDPESGLSHLGHYLANLVMLAHFYRWYPEGNDLPPPEFFREAAADADVKTVMPDEGPLLATSALPYPEGDCACSACERVRRRDQKVAEKIVKAQFPPFFIASKL